MRNYIAGCLTALVFIVLYFVVSGFKSRLEGFGMEMPKYLKVGIALSDTFVNFYYVFLPLLFFMLRFLVGLIIADSDTPTGSGPQE